MYQNFYTSRPGFGYDLEVSPRIKGEKLSGLKGGLQIGMRLKPTDTAATLLQPWLISFSTTLAILETSLGKTTVPDLPAGTVDSSMVNTKFVQSAVAALIAQVKGNPPATLDTFAKFAQAIGNDPQYLTNTLAKIAAKANLSEVVNRAVGVGEFTGSAPNYTVALTNSALTEPVNGMVLRIKATAANTGALTLTTSMSGDTAKPILLGNGQALRAGDIVGDGFWATLQYSSAHSAWLLVNPANALNQKFATLADLNANTNAGFVSPSVLKDYLTLKLGSVSGAITTLQALYDALGGDANFAANLLVTLATKAPKDNPVLTGTPTGVTVDVATNNTREATTAFVTAAIAAAAASIVIAEATTTVAGKVLIASSNKFDLGEDTSSFVTPAQAKQAFSTLMLASSSEFTDVVYGVTRPLGTLDSSWATSRFLESALYAKFDQATDTLVGAARIGQASEYNTGSVDTYVTPLALKTKLDQIPPVPDASTTTVGKVRLASAITDTGGVLTPALLKAAVDLKIAQAATGFAAPSVGVPASSYAGSPLSIDLNASPGGTATSITQFKITISAVDGSWTTPEAVVSATNNSATYNFTPTNAQSGLTQVSVIAVDNLNANSPSQVETLTIYVITVNTPQFTYPLSGNTGVSQTATLTSSDFGLSQGAGTHTKSDWKITSSASGSEVVIQSSLDDAVNLKSYQLDTGVIGSLATYKAYVRYYDATYGWSDWGSVSFTTDAGSAPVLAQTLSSPGAKLYGYYGYDVQMTPDGQWLTVGAPGENKVYVYKWDSVGKTFVSNTTLTGDNDTNYIFGLNTKIADCATVMASVSYPKTAPNASTTLRIFIFKLINNVWTRITTTLSTAVVAGSLNWSDGTNANMITGVAQFKPSLAISGDGTRVTVANACYQSTGTPDGGVEVFYQFRETDSATNTWTYDGSYNPSYTLSTTMSTSLNGHADYNNDGSRLYISYQVAGGVSVNPYAVMIERKRTDGTTNTWTNGAVFYSTLYMNPAIKFVGKVELSGDGTTLVVSKPYHFAVNSNGLLASYEAAGAIQVNRKSPTGTFVGNASESDIYVSPIINGAVADKFLGRDFSLSYDGSSLIASAVSQTDYTYNTTLSSNKDGKVFIFKITGTGTTTSITLNQTLSPPAEAATGAVFGHTLAADGNHNNLAVGAFKANGTYTNEGKVYLYKL